MQRSTVRDTASSVAHRTEQIVHALCTFDVAAASATQLLIDIIEVLLQFEGDQRACSCVIQCVPYYSILTTRWRKGINGPILTFAAWNWHCCSASNCCASAGAQALRKSCRRHSIYCAFLRVVPNEYAAARMGAFDVYAVTAMATASCCTVVMSWCMCIAAELTGAAPTATPKRCRAQGGVRCPCRPPPWLLAAAQMHTGSKS